MKGTPNGSRRLLYVVTCILIVACNIIQLIVMPSSGAKLPVDQLSDNFDNLLAKKTTPTSTKETGKFLEDAGKLLDSVPKLAKQLEPTGENAKLLDKLKEECGKSSCSKGCFDAMGKVIESNDPKKQTRRSFYDMYLEMYDQQLNECAAKIVKQLRAIYFAPEKKEESHKVHELAKFFEETLFHHPIEICPDEIRMTDMKKLSVNQISSIGTQCREIGMLNSKQIDELKDLISIDKKRILNALDGEMEKYAAIMLYCAHATM